MNGIFFSLLVIYVPDPCDVFLVCTLYAIHFCHVTDARRHECPASFCAHGYHSSHNRKMMHCAFTELLGFFFIYKLWPTEYFDWFTAAQLDVKKKKKSYKLLSIEQSIVLFIHGLKSSASSAF